MLKNLGLVVFPGSKLRTATPKNPDGNTLPIHSNVVLQMTSKVVKSMSTFEAPDPKSGKQDTKHLKMKQFLHYCSSAQYLCCSSWYELIFYADDCTLLSTMAATERLSIYIIYRQAEWTISWTLTPGKSSAALFILWTKEVKHFFDIHIENAPVQFQKILEATFDTYISHFSSS